MSVRVAEVSDFLSLKLLAPKQMIQRALIALVRVKAGDGSENLLNEIGQIIYSLY